MRLIAALLALLVGAPALAFEASRFNSPIFNTPNVDWLAIQALGSTGQIGVSTPSIAGLRAMPVYKATAGMVVQVAGYYAAGDEGGGAFKWVPGSSAADDGCVVIKPTAVSGNGRWLRTTTGTSLSVKQCGAKGDGVANDTAAIQAAVNYAESTASLESYWGATTLGAVYFPPGYYFTDGIDVRRQIRFYGDSTGSVTLALRAGANRSVIRSYAAPLTDGSQTMNYGQAVFENFTISGNSGGQTGASHGIEFVDAPYAITTRYATAGRVRNVHIMGAKGHGIYFGRNRNLSFVDAVVINYNQGSGLFFQETGDAQISNSSIGANQDGITVFGSYAVTLSTSAIYNNTGHGVVVSGFSGSYVLITGTTIGANGVHGVTIVPDGSAPNLVVGLSNVHLTDNSQSADNAYAHIYARTFGQIMLSNVWVNKSTSVQPAYVIDNDNTGYISADGLLFDRATAPPFKTADFRMADRVIGNRDVRSGSFSLGVPLNLVGQSPPTSSSDSSGNPGDVRLVGNTLYWKTSSGWVRLVGGAF